MLLTYALLYNYSSVNLKKNMESMIFLPLKANLFMVHFVILTINILLKGKHYIIFIYKKSEFITFLLDQVYLYFEEFSPLENISLLFQILLNIMIINNLALSFRDNYLYFLVRKVNNLMVYLLKNYNKHPFTLHFYSLIFKSLC